MPDILPTRLTPKERVRRALWRLPVDHLPCQTNFTGTMGRLLADHLGCTQTELQAKLHNHLLRVDVSHPKTLSDDGKTSFDWWGAGWGTETEGYWHAHAPLADSEDLNTFPWPDPNEENLLDEAAAAIAADHNQHFVVPNFGFALFERAWSLRGFDQFLMDLICEPEFANDLLDRITTIQTTLAQRFVALGVDGGYFGDDYGAQKSLLFSPILWREMIKPRLARMFAVFRDAGLPVILHSDGDIWPILPDLVEIGLTCLNPVQPEVLDHARLQREYGNQLSFYGGISTQGVLPNGSPSDVAAATRQCIKQLAPNGTGLLIGPSHRMQSDIPPPNAAAMLAAFPS